MFFGYYLVYILCVFVVFFQKYHPKSSCRHQQTVADVPEHHRKQERERHSGVDGCSETQMNYSGITLLYKWCTTRGEMELNHVLIMYTLLFVYFFYQSHV